MNTLERMLLQWGSLDDDFVLDALSQETLTVSSILELREKLEDGSLIQFRNDYLCLIDGEMRLVNVKFYLALLLGGFSVLPVTADELESLAFWESASESIVIHLQDYSYSLKFVKLSKLTTFSKPLTGVRSSGSTSAPRTMLFNIESKIARAEVTNKALECRVGGTLLGSSHLFHSLGQRNVFLALTAKQKLVLPHRIQSFKSFFDLVEDYKVDYWVPVSSQVNLIFDSNIDQHQLSVVKLKSILFSSADLNINSLETLKQIPECNLREIYGIADVGCISMIDLRKYSRDFGVGFPFEHVRLDVPDISIHDRELTLRVSARGYCPLASITESGDDLVLHAINSDSWFDTGDLVRIESDPLMGRYLVLKGRSAFSICVGGKVFNPESFEEKICEKLFISGVLLIPRADEIMGHLITAYFLRSEVSKVGGLSQLKKAIKELLPRELVPRRIETLESFRYLPNGKLDRRSYMDQI